MIKGDDMNLEHLNSLIHIIEYQSFSKAAEKLYITQPTISNHINKLEEELDTVILIRNKKEVKLTKQGEIVYNYALDALQMEKNIKNEINLFNQDISGKLEISSSTIPERYFLLSILSEFHSAFPDVKFTLKKHDSFEIIDLLLKSKIDFGIIGTKVLHSNLIYHDLFEDEIVLIGSKKFFDNNHKISLEETFNYPFVSREIGSGTRNAISQYYEKNKLNYNHLDIIFEIEDNECILDLLDQGEYLAFLSKEVLKKAKDNYVIIDFGKRIHRSFYFAYNKKRIMSPLSEKFKNYILKENDAD
jgi:DNA-binding transcriptional LysR family regulator